MVTSTPILHYVMHGSVGEGGAACQKKQRAFFGRISVWSCSRGCSFGVYTSFNDFTEQVRHLYALVIK